MWLSTNCALLNNEEFLSKDNQINLQQVSQILMLLSEENSPHPPPHPLLLIDLRRKHRNWENIITISHDNFILQHYRVEFVDKLVQVIGRLHHRSQQSHKSHIVALEIQSI